MSTYCLNSIFDTSHLLGLILFWDENICRKVLFQNTCSESTIFAIIFCSQRHAFVFNYGENTIYNKIAVFRTSCTFSSKYVFFNIFPPKNISVFIHTSNRFYIGHKIVVENYWKSAKNWKYLSWHILYIFWTRLWLRNVSITLTFF